MCSAVEKMQSRFRRLRMAGILFLKFWSEISLRMCHLHSEVSVERCGLVSSECLVTSWSPSSSPSPCTAIRVGGTEVLLGLFSLPCGGWGAAEEVPQRKILKREYTSSLSHTTALEPYMWLGSPVGVKTITIPVAVPGSYPELARDLMCLPEIDCQLF